VLVPKAVLLLVLLGAAAAVAAAANMPITWLTGAAMRAATLRVQVLLDQVR
jgi:hypothetical protein